VIRGDRILDRKPEPSDRYGVDLWRGQFVPGRPRQDLYRTLGVNSSGEVMEIANECDRRALPITRIDVFKRNGQICIRLQPSLAGDWRVVDLKQKGAW
jgi:hypothetical protein